ncbi:MAG: hypothetical protein R8M38_10030 [Mariprofundaceae bacterium]
MTQIDIAQVETNITKMLADIEHSRKTFTLEVIKMVVYAMIGGSTLTLALLKIYQ